MINWNYYKSELRRLEARYPEQGLALRLSDTLVDLLDDLYLHDVGRDYGGSSMEKEVQRSESLRDETRREYLELQREFEILKRSHEELLDYVTLHINTRSN